MPRKKTEKKTTTPRAVPAKPPEPVPARPAGDKGDAATSYCLIVGCGASAGGLEAFTDLLQHVPENAGLAIILIQHLDPTHASVLTELLSRATKMPVVQITDGMHVEASRVYVIPPNTNISVRQGVQDTGTGMDTETRSHIFEPFFTTKPRGTGSGLGLSTTYNIVKQSGGYIAAYSELGVGSTFTVYLPRVEGEPVRAEERPEAEWRGAETVLVVEDENAVRELTRTFLEMRGYRVLQAVYAAGAGQGGAARAGPGAGRGCAVREEASVNRRPVTSAWAR